MFKKNENYNLSDAEIKVLELFHLCDRIDFRLHEETNEEKAKNIVSIISEPSFVESEGFRWFEGAMEVENNKRICAIVFMKEKRPIPLQRNQSST